LASAWRQLGFSFNKPQSDGTSFDGLLLRRMDRPRSAKGANFNLLCVFYSVDGTAFVTTGDFSTNMVSLLLILAPVCFSIDFRPSWY